jgi:tetratricopeptide (TPR) repeat protein
MVGSRSPRRQSSQHVVARTVGCGALVAILCLGARADAADQFVRPMGSVVALTHVRVIDGTGAPAKSDQTLIVKDGRIASLGAAATVAIPPNATVLDLHGRSVIPGLVGMNDHLFYEIEAGRSSIPIVAQRTFAKLYLGVNAYDLNAYNNLGRAYTQQRKFAEAEAAFEHELQINPLDQSAHANLGGMYLEWRKHDRAAAELEKAIALDPKDATLRIRLGEAYLNLHQRERAMASFDRAVELDASPRTWNEVAYQLALNKTDLDLGLQYAESAVTSLATASRNVSVERVTAYGLWQIGELAASWDTLGWVYFATGDLDRAERFVRASWLLIQHADVGDHLAQIYERQGRRDDAVRIYAQALNAERPDERTRERLAALAGPNASVDQIVSRHGDDLARERSFAVDINGPEGASAEFFVLFGRGSIDGVKFIGGDERLRPFVDALRAVTYRAMFPDDTPTKVLRRGTLSCGSTDGRRGCQFVMALPHEAQLAEQRR